MDRGSEQVRKRKVVMSVKSDESLERNIKHTHLRDSHSIADETDEDPFDIFHVPIQLNKDDTLENL
jgi:hypothetical protein